MKFTNGEIDKRIDKIVNVPYEQIFVIGEPFEKGVTNYEEGIKVDLSEMGMTILFTMRDPTPGEIGAIRSGNIRLALVPIDDVLFICTKFGNMPWWEAPFNINLSQLRTLTGREDVLPQLPPPGQGYQCIIFLVDAATGIIEVMRQVGLSHQFCRDIVGFTLVMEKNNRAFDRKEYEKKVDKVFGTIEIGKLANMAFRIFELHKEKWTTKEIEK